MYFDGITLDKIEWRNSPRIDHRVMVDVVLDGRLLKENSLNLSENGIFLASKNTGAYNIFDKLTLCFPAAESTPIKRIGRVARKTDNGVGVVFLDENRSKLTEY